MTSSACVVGLGYVGLPLAVALVESGVDVLEYDMNPAADHQPPCRAQRHRRRLRHCGHHPGARLHRRRGRPGGLLDVRLVRPHPLREGTPDLGAVESASRRRPGDAGVHDLPGWSECPGCPLVTAPKL
ncbi:MAG: hypothetical protein M3381_13820 [Actinomycetota bacterium]|nr:hypothetical protein [Actinomycetota bacterium]